MHETTDFPEILTRAEAAKFLRICATSLDRLKDLPKTRLGKRIVYQKAALIRWMDQGERHDR
jgi:hypothetical protein